MSTRDAHIGIRNEIRAFIHRRSTPTVTDDQDVFATGIANSLFAMELIMFLERQFAITIPPSDQSREHLATIDAMTALVEALSTTVDAGDHA